MGEGAATPASVPAFEAAHGIALPPAYRRYVIERSVDLEDTWAQPHASSEMPERFLESPFPHSSAWNDAALRSAGGGYESAYYAREHWCGAMRIINAGCESYFLLAVTGPERNHIWYDGRQDGLGIVPVEDETGSHVPFEGLL